MVPLSPQTKHLCGLGPGCASPFHWSLPLPPPRGLHFCTALHYPPVLVDVVHVSLISSTSPPSTWAISTMASAIMASQAVAVAGLGSSLLRTREVHSLRGSLRVAKNSSRQLMSPIRAAKLPQGVAAPKDEPKLPVSFWGFTENAEVWNSRASMIGLFGIIIVEALIHRGILQAIGVDVGKGLDLPL